MINFGGTVALLRYTCYSDVYSLEVCENVYELAPT